MNQKEPMSAQSKIRELLIKAQIALQEERYEEALSAVMGINTEEMANLSSEELLAVGNLLNHLKEISEEKKRNLVDELKKIQAGKEYLS